jgi:hypothetical protein
MYNCESEAAYKEESRFQVCLNHTPCKTLVEARKGQSSSVRVLKPAGLLFHDSCLSSKACGFISCGHAFFSLRLSAFDREIWRNLRRRGAVQGASVRTGKGLCPWGGWRSECACHRYQHHPAGLLPFLSDRPFPLSRCMCRSPCRRPKHGYVVVGRTEESGTRRREREKMPWRHQPTERGKSSCSCVSKGAGGCCLLMPLPPCCWLPSHGPG